MTEIITPETPDQTGHKHAAKWQSVGGAVQEKEDQIDRMLGLAAWREICVQRRINRMTISSRSIPIVIMPNIIIITVSILTSLGL